MKTVKLLNKLHKMFMGNTFFLECTLMENLHHRLHLEILNGPLFRHKISCI